ncbi:hypothetical protein VNO78_03410 [Psophocarpus tetragonolobus]|uniref:Uncharacterized protein n=1 Tax=Psophocarpus tetragonolobus TaxID=3891 RepID=A0AAN9TDZ1_PSOTE
MEAHKEKMEQVQKEEEKKIGSEKISNEENEIKGDTVIKRVIGDNQRAQTPHDVLVFSRCVPKVDSSLQ